LELKDNQIEFPPELEADLDDRGMNILIASDLKTNEHCLVLFSGERWKGKGEGGGEPLKASFDGRVLAIPARLASRILGGAKGQVAVLRLKDRIEIWSKESLDRYFQAAPEIQIMPPYPQTPRPESSPVPSSSSFPIEIGPA
jgi:hypothetical protein